MLLNSFFICWEEEKGTKQEMVEACPHLREMTIIPTSLVEALHSLVLGWVTDKNQGVHGQRRRMDVCSRALCSLCPGGAPLHNKILQKIWLQATEDDLKHVSACVKRAMRWKASLRGVFGLRTSTKARREQLVWFFLQTLLPTLQFLFFLFKWAHI